MANCVDTLEAVLGSVDCKLDSILYQLEHKLCQIETPDGGDGQPIVMSCSQMITDLKDIQRDVQAIRSQRKELQELEKQLSDQLWHKCKGVEKDVLKLKRTVNYE